MSVTKTYHVAIRRETSGLTYDEKVTLTFYRPDNTFHEEIMTKEDAQILANSLEGLGLLP